MVTSQGLHLIRGKEPTACLSPFPIASPESSMGDPMQIGAAKSSLSSGEKQRRRDWGLSCYCGALDAGSVKASAADTKCRTCQSTEHVTRNSPVIITLDSVLVEFGATTNFKDTEKSTEAHVAYSSSRKPNANQDD